MIDGRLLVPAITAWTAAVVTTVVLRSVVGLADRHEWAVRSVLVAALLAVATAVVSWRLGAPSTVKVALAGLLVGCGCAAFHLAALTSAPVSSWVSARATATVWGVVNGEPIVRTPPPSAAWSSGSRLEVPLATSAISARGQATAVDLPMLLRLPADADVPPQGTAVRVVGRLSPGRPAADVAGVLTSDAKDEHLSIVGEPGWIDRWAQAMRTGLRSSLVGTAPDAGSLVAGLSIGDESAASGSLRDDMRASGLSHLTAVSGGNVAILVGGVLAVVVALRLALVARVLTALAAVALFVVLVGPGPSVVRAAVMGGLVLIGLIVGGRRAGPSVLAAAVLILVIVAPALTVSWGFALSAGATGGIVLLAPVLHDRLLRWGATARWPPIVVAALSVTGAAQIATLPLLISMGGAVGWVALPANLLAMPVVAPITVLGLMSAVLAPLLPAVAVVLAHGAAWPAAWIATIAHLASQAPGASLPLPPGLLGLVALVGVVLAGLAGIWMLRQVYPEGVPAVVRGGSVALIAVTIGMWVLFPPSRRGWPPDGWLMIMCDVGQGDALLVRSGQASAVVVDVGPDPNRVDVCLDDAAVTQVPAVVLTHFHADHVGGLAGVFRGRSVGAVFVNPVRDPPQEAAAVDRVLSAEGIEATPITSGDSRRVGEVTWRAIWPRRVITAGSVPNNASIVLLVDVDGHRLALMGDVEPEAQAALAADLVGQRIDVMKVPHHGSKYQDPRLAQLAPAAIALISVGEGNDYGHPADETIRAWQAIGALVARTDRNGDISVVASAAGLNVVTRHGMLPTS